MGTFTWLDCFLKDNPQYTEISDRMILDWAEKSGLVKSKNKSSNDRPEWGFGLTMMDDGSLRKLLHNVAPLHSRNYVVMEVKSALMKNERKDMLNKWEGGKHKRTAVVLVGEPKDAFKKHTKALMLKQKQSASDKEFAFKSAEAKRKKATEKKAKELVNKKKADEKAKKKKEAENKKKIEEAKKKAVAKAAAAKKKAEEEAKKRAEGDEAKDEEENAEEEKPEEEKEEEPAEEVAEEESEQEPEEEGKRACQQEKG